MKKKYLSRNLLIEIIVVFTFIMILFFVAAYNQIMYKSNNQIVENNCGNTGGIYGENEVIQSFKYNGDIINQILIKAGTYARNNNGNLQFEINEANTDKTIWKGSKELSGLEDNSDIILDLNKKIERGNGEYYIRIYSDNCDETNSITVYYNNSSVHDGNLSVNGEDVDAELEMAIYGGTENAWANYFWIIVVAIIVVFSGYFYLLSRQEKMGKSNWLVHLCDVIYTYKFLMKQLISRDFKTKYKRSVLGVFWSFLNPLLTMVVQYIVFSTIFRANIRNYPVYLLSASIMFSFFTEAVGGGLGSIVSNASLIKKVYAPKYIYPITKVLSTAINLMISLIPLLAVILFTGERINIHYLLIPYVMVCLIAFCIGMSLIMATSNVFFRDTQFLWGILSLLWMYATPMFYPASIIPERFHFVLVANPMYAFISFFRTILLDYSSPQMIDYIACAGWAIAFCVIGGFLFNKFQKRFVLYL